MPHFNRLDICAAYYLFGMNYHGGQFTKEYRYTSRAEKCGFRYGYALKEENLTENAQAIYNGLMERNGYLIPNFEAP